MIGSRAGRRTLRGFAACVAVLLVTAAAAGEPRRIGFDQLPDPAARDFHDPFRTMGADSLAELKVLVRLRERLAEGAVDPLARPRLEARVASARASLTADGHDIDGLLEQRWEIARKRRDALLAVNPALVGEAVAMSGYLIPAHPLEDGTATGYLVAAVGLCSHLPVPPPNQLVRVRFTGAGVPQVTLYTPMRIAGTLRDDMTDETIFVLDGEVRMVSRWTLAARNVAVEAGPDSVAAFADWRDPLVAPSDVRAESRDGSRLGEPFQ
jgi:hypothetical protein